MAEAVATRKKKAGINEPEPYYGVKDPEEIAKLKGITGNITDRHKRTIEENLALGKDYLDAKAMIPHDGTWGKYLRDFGCQRVAQEYMNTYQVVEASPDLRGTLANLRSWHALTEFVNIVVHQSAHRMRGYYGLGRINFTDDLWAKPVWKIGGNGALAEYFVRHGTEKTAIHTTEEVEKKHTSCMLEKLREAAPGSVTSADVEKWYAKLLFDWLKPAARAEAKKEKELARKREEREKKREAGQSHGTVAPEPTAEEIAAEEEEERITREKGNILGVKADQREDICSSVDTLHNLGVEISADELVVVMLADEKAPREFDHDWSEVMKKIPTVITYLQDVLKELKK